MLKPKAGLEGKTQVLEAGCCHFPAVICCRCRELAEPCRGADNCPRKGSVEPSLKSFSSSPLLCPALCPRVQSLVSSGKGQRILGGCSTAGRKCVAWGSTSSAGFNGPWGCAGLLHSSNLLMGMKSSRPPPFSPWCLLCLPHCSPEPSAWLPCGFWHPCGRGFAVWFGVVCSPGDVWHVALLTKRPFSG